MTKIKSSDKLAMANYTKFNAPTGHVGTVSMDSFTMSSLRGKSKAQTSFSGSIQIDAELTGLGKVLLQHGRIMPPETALLAILFRVDYSPHWYPIGVCDKYGRIGRLHWVNGDTSSNLFGGWWWSQT